jgi:hypothetical protein
MFITKIVNIVRYLSWKWESPPENDPFQAGFTVFFDPDIADYPTLSGA